MGFLNGLIAGFTGVSLSVSQNTPTGGMSAPPPTLNCVKQERWTPDSGVSLFNKKASIERQRKTHQKLTAQGLSPFVNTQADGSKYISWQLAPLLPSSGNNKEQDYTKPIVIDNGYKEVPPRKNWSELTSSEKWTRGTFNFCNFLTAPFSTTSKLFAKDTPTSKPGWFRSYVLPICDVGYTAVSAVLCPPLFFTSIGGAMGSALLYNTSDIV